jgi:translation initiation factor 1A
MPPNAKGGKGYKKKKKSGDTVGTPIFIDLQEGQMLGRVIRLLGNRNVLCFCVDNILRICHICGRMKGRVWIEPGDLVLISLRELSNIIETKGVTRGDVIAKYDPEQHGSLRRQYGSDAKIFMKLETMDGLTLNEVGIDKTNDRSLIAAEHDIGFVFEDNDGEEEGENGEAAGGAAAGGAAAGGRSRAPVQRPTLSDRNTEAALKSGNDDEVDIDAI